MEIIEQATFRHHNTVIIDRDDGVWLTFCAEWWEFSSWIVWYLLPGKKAWLQLKVQGKVEGSTRTIRVQAKRISRTYVRMG
jgi:hypothetical protein